MLFINIGFDWVWLNNLFYSKAKSKDFSPPQNVYEYQLWPLKYAAGREIFLLHFAMGSQTLR
jgi:hypothetical protein